MATTSVDYKHPYATITWQHQPTGGAWQDASLLSGYVGGQGTKTLELSGATEAETGFLRAEITNPAGASVYSDLATLSATAEAPNITVGISDPEPYEGESATYGPITVTGIPAPTLLWEAETADGNNTWADADTVFGADGSGQGTDTYVIANAVPADNRDVRVTATNTQGSDVSQAALTVTPTLAFTTDPQDQTILETVTGTPEYLIDFTLKDRGAWTHTRAGNATAPDENGIIQTYTDQQPAWYRDQGLQLEDTSTNYLNNSQEFTGTWSNFQLDVSTGDVGTRNVATTKLAANTSNNAHRFHDTSPYSLTAGQVVSCVYVVKPDGCDWFQINPGLRFDDTKYINVNLSTKAIGNSSGDWSTLKITDEVNGFKRIEFQETATGSGGTPWISINIMESDLAGRWATWVGGSNKGIHFDYAQYEFPQAFITSYMSTSGATYTRAATSCSATFAELGDPLPAGGFTNDFCFQFTGVMLASLSDIRGDAQNHWINIGSTAANCVQIRVQSTTSFRARIYKNSVLTEIDVTPPTLNAGDTFDIRFRMSATLPDKLWVNGVSSENTDAAGFSVNVTDVYIGNDRTGGRQTHIAASKLRIVPEALSDEQIEAWT